jgi:hypothetical protein
MQKDLRLHCMVYKNGREADGDCDHGFLVSGIDRDIQILLTGLADGIRYVF